jgi:calcineurin-like phosphoesterase family protein
MKFDKLKTKGNVWITSDTHYAHKNICLGVTAWRNSDGTLPVDSTRHFDSLESMNDSIVNNINSVVGQDDTLIHLGDFSFGGFENIGKFLDRLVCKNIHLLIGNHDHHIKYNRDNIQESFLSVAQYQEVIINGKYFVLSHYPLQSWHGLSKGVIHLHGHVHLPEHKKMGNGKKMDVGVDGNGLKPYLLDDIIKIMDKRSIGSELEDDHHIDDKIGVVG